MIKWFRSLFIRESPARARKRVSRAIRAHNQFGIKSNWLYQAEGNLW